MSEIDLPADVLLATAAMAEKRGAERVAIAEQELVTPSLGADVPFGYPRGPRARAYVVAFGDDKAQSVTYLCVARVARVEPRLQWHMDWIVTREAEAVDG